MCISSPHRGELKKMPPGPTPRCGGGTYVLADAGTVPGHFPIDFNCLIQRGAFFLALIAS